MMFAAVRSAAVRNLKPSHQVIVRGKKTSAWLSDPATYPLLCVLAGGAMLCSGFGFWFARTNPSVRVNKQERQQLFRQ